MWESSRFCLRRLTICYKESEPAYVANRNVNWSSDKTDFIGTRNAPKTETRRHCYFIVLNILNNNKDSEAYVTTHSEMS
jgi:hypothetical protein